MRQLRTPLISALLTVAIPDRSGACTIVYPSFQVGPSFHVKIEDRGRPVAGLRVRIGAYLGEPKPAFAETDKDGIAFFRGVRPGSYVLSADHDTSIGDAAILDVKLNGPSDFIVRLTWPIRAPIAILSLKGSLRGPEFVLGEPRGVLTIELLEGISGRVLRTIQTDNRGDFDLENTKPGLYFLKLKPVAVSRYETTGLIGVTVDRNAPEERLDLDLTWTSCGLQYTDSSRCPQPSLEIAKLAGQVVDPNGTPFSNATILVRDPDGTPVEGLKSDDRGEFASTRAVSGTYQLVVSMAGFTPFRQTLQVKPETTRASRLTVKLGLGGCSAATVE